MVDSKKKYFLGIPHKVTELTTAHIGPQRLSLDAVLVLRERIVYVFLTLAEMHNCLGKGKICLR